MKPWHRNTIYCRVVACFVSKGSDRGFDSWLESGMKSTNRWNTDTKSKLRASRQSLVRMKSAAFTQVLVNSQSVCAAGFSRLKAPFSTVMDEKAQNMNHICHFLRKVSPTLGSKSIGTPETITVANGTFNVHLGVLMLSVLAQCGWNEKKKFALKLFFKQGNWKFQS